MKLATLHTHIVPLSMATNLPNDNQGSNIVRALFPGLQSLPENSIQNDSLILPGNMPATPIRRLIVIIPEGEFDTSTLARRIWKLAASDNLKIIFVALSPDAQESAYWRRYLANLVSMTTSKELQVDAHVFVEKNWQRVLKEIFQPGDLFVCLANHKTTRGIISQGNLGERISESLTVPVYLIGDLKIDFRRARKQKLVEVLGWAASIVLLVSFFSLQVAINRLESKNLSTTLMILSVFVEFYFLWKINAWIG